MFFECCFLLCMSPVSIFMSDTLVLILKSEGGLCFVFLFCFFSSLIPPCHLWESSSLVSPLRASGTENRTGSLFSGLLPWKRIPKRWKPIRHPSLCFSDSVWMCAVGISIVLCIIYYHLFSDVFSIGMCPRTHTISIIISNVCACWKYRLYLFHKVCFAYGCFSYIGYFGYRRLEDLSVGITCRADWGLAQINGGINALSLGWPALQMAE